MYLSSEIARLTCESGNTYVISINQEKTTYRLFWEADDEDDGFECFTTFDVEKTPPSIDNAVEKSKQLVHAHQLEDGNVIEITKKPIFL